MTSGESKYWLDLTVDQIEERFPTGEIVVSSGISPSASYHVGHFREILTAEALAWGLRQRGREVVHKHVVDNFDPLRRRYDFLPEEYERYVGWPICLVPDPFDDCRDEHQSYAEHFYQEFAGFARRMGVTDIEVVRSYQGLYKSGKMAQNIELAVEKADLIRQTFARLSNRQLPSVWMPLQLLSPSNSFTELKFKSIDKSSKTVTGIDAAGKEVELRYDQGQVKLNWRLDWPARWQILGVMVEPFGVQEHGAAGSSYDTGAVFSKEIFNWPPPIPAAKYANIHLIGDTKKMSSSKGNLITPAEALKIMPPEILRYFVLRSKPEVTLYFDPGLGLFNLIEEYTSIEQAVREGHENPFQEAYHLAQAGASAQTISSVPFSHLVSVYQTAQEDEVRAEAILRRTGYEKEVSEQGSILRREFEYVKNWLDKYAPEEVKFKVSDELPKAGLSDKQEQFLVDLATKIASENDLDGQGMHDLVYATAEASELKPAEAFQALYRIILGQDSGPKAGWFLASLDRAWLIKRLRLEK